MTIFAMALSLFIIMDPIGNSPLFVSLVKDYSPKRQRYIIIREHIVALAVILLFCGVGHSFLEMLHITPPALSIASGVVLFLISLRMTFSGITRPEREDQNEEPFITPMAVPMLAGPSVLATVMLYTGRETGTGVVVISIVLAWVSSLLIFLMALHLASYLGKKTIRVTERLMGIVLIIISIQMFLEGVAMFVRTLEL
jgi:multiple antibiotic resistance protein